MIRLYGVIRHGGSPVEGAYVQLIGPSGDFTAERRTDETGHFLFYPVEGQWSIRGLAPGGLRAERNVELSDGQSLDLAIDI